MPTSMADRRLVCPSKTRFRFGRQHGDRRGGGQEAPGVEIHGGRLRRRVRDVPLPSGPNPTGAMPLGANSGGGGAFCPAGLFETADGDPLVLNLSAAVPVAGRITYVE